MTQYAVLLKQIGNGCGYTIGCGKTWQFFEADSLQEAYIKAKSFILEDPNAEYPDEPPSLKYYDEDHLASAHLVEIKAELPVEAWYNEWIVADRVRRAREKEEKERAEFERLKAKYEGKA